MIGRQSGKGLGLRVTQVPGSGATDPVCSTRVLGSRPFDGPSASRACECGVKAPPAPKPPRPPTRKGSQPWRQEPLDGGILRASRAGVMAGCSRGRQQELKLRSGLRNLDERQPATMEAATVNKEAGQKRPGIIAF